MRERYMKIFFQMYSRLLPAVPVPTLLGVASPVNHSYVAEQSNERALNLYKQS